MTEGAAKPASLIDLAALTTFYNGACPICRMEIEHYKRLSAAAGLAGELAWCDISREPNALAARGLVGDALTRRLHVVDGDRHLLSGVEAFAAIWRHLPRYRWLARLTRVAWLKPALEAAYEALAWALFHWNKRRAATAGNAPSNP